MFLHCFAHRSLFPLAGVVCSVLLSGCGGSASPTSPQAQISGTVTIDGKQAPLDTTVTFWAADEGGGGTGSVDAAGRFVIKSAAKERGLPAGRYKVSVMPKAPPPVNTSSEDYKKMMLQGSSGAPAPPKDPAADAIPVKYRNPESSGLVFEVQPGANDIPIKLTTSES